MSSYYYIRMLMRQRLWSARADTWARQGGCNHQVAREYGGQGGARQGLVPHWCSFYLLYWYKSTNTDATRAAVRDQKAFSFIELNDGSMPKGIQVQTERPTTAKRPTTACTRETDHSMRQRDLPLHAPLTCYSMRPYATSVDACSMRPYATHVDACS